MGCTLCNLFQLLKENESRSGLPESNPLDDSEYLIELANDIVQNHPGLSSLIWKGYDRRINCQKRGLLMLKSSTEIFNDFESGLRRTKVKISEIFRSISGEGMTQGYPAVFVRFAGCNLNCSWCDTTYAKQGENMTLHDVLDKVKSFLPIKLICITGGEPTLQKQEVLSFINNNDIMKGYKYTIFTNGTQDIQDFIKPHVSFCLDVKMPSSGMYNKIFTDPNLYATLQYNIALLRPQDEVKFVIADRADWDVAIAFSEAVLRRFACQAQITYSPMIAVNGSGAVINPKLLQDLAQWILDEAPANVNYSLQIQKFIWGAGRGV